MNFKPESEYLQENAKLLEERNAAIRMAWELVQELAQKCNDPIHKRQLEELRELHAEYILSNDKITNPAPKTEKLLK